MAGKTNEVAPLAAMGMAAATAAGTAAGTTAVNRIADKLGASKMNKGKMIKKEGVEEQSELILAAKDMMDKVTGYLEDLASMKTEGMLELADRIRDEMGADKADAFIQKIQPAIEQAEATLSTTRQELDNGVRILTGEEVASEPMGADDTMDLDTDTDSLDSVDMDDTESDEFGASDAEAGGTEPEGREQRESKEVFESSNRLYSKLAGK
jgi:vacuolar-type H+-ATPase subunit I/STV1